MEFRSALKEAGAEYRLSQERKKIRKLVLRVSISAAGFLLLFGSVFLYFTLGHQHLSPDRIFADNYSPYLSASMTFRSGGSQHQDIFARAVKYYDEGRYQESMQVLDSILFANPSNGNARFYAGMAQLGLRDFKTAEASLQKVMDNENSLFAEQAEWYRSLCLVILNDRKNAILHFRHLASGNGYYSRRATEILKELDSR